MIAPFLFALLLTFVLVPLLLPLLRRRQWGQEVRREGPRTHLLKSGTPTMGGLAIILPVLAASLIWGDITSPFLQLTLLVFAGFGALGFLDDFLKVVLRRPLGLKARYKLLGQGLLALILAFEVAQGLGTRVAVPFTPLEFDLGLLYVPFAILAIIGSANAANLTDGLDGLLAGTTVAVAAAYTFISIESGRPDLAVFAAALAGGCLGFLGHNVHPARIFMGDTGSLALGGALAAMALLTKTELILPLAAGVWVLETLSVMIQVVSFQLWGRRVFRMSPLHHHFELAGWTEGQVVARFWLLAAVLAGAGLFVFLRG